VRPGLQQHAVDEGLRRDRCEGRIEALCQHRLHVPVRFDAKVALLEQHGVQAVLAQRFDPAFAAITAQAFVDGVLLQGLGARHVVCGYDFTFGARRSGNVERLRELAAERPWESPCSTR